jgi:hypothetical protein
MTFDVLCTFDLKNASRQDYEVAYAVLKQLGLVPAVKGSKSDVVIPTTTVMGRLEGSSRESVRDEVRAQIRSAFKVRGLDSEIFILAGAWTWGSTTT